MEGQALSRELMYQFIDFKPIFWYFYSISYEPTDTQTLQKTFHGCSTYRWVLFQSDHGRNMPKCCCDGNSNSHIEPHCILWQEVKKELQHLAIWESLTICYLDKVIHEIVTTLNGVSTALRFRFFGNVSSVGWSHESRKFLGRSWITAWQQWCGSWHRRLFLSNVNRKKFSNFLYFRFEIQTICGKRILFNDKNAVRE